MDSEHQILFQFETKLSEVILNTLNTNECAGLTECVSPVQDKTNKQDIWELGGGELSIQLQHWECVGFQRFTGLIDLHGKQRIQSMSSPVARCMMVWIYVEVKNAKQEWI